MSSQEHRLADTGLSSRRCHGFTTRGVRADRVGVALSLPPTPGNWGRVEQEARDGASRPRQPPNVAPAAGGPWPVKPRLVTVLARERGFGLGSAVSTVLPVLGAGSDGWRGYGRACRRRPSAAMRRAGFGPYVAEPMPKSGAGGARERTPDSLFVHEAGIGRSRGGARGSVWLQKSTSGVWSRFARTAGLALWLVSHASCAGRAQRVKGRRKPGRGGESHEHASSDTGGGLLVIPRARRASAGRARGKEHSSMEGVLVRRGCRL